MSFNALVLPLQADMRKKAKALTKNDADADDLLQDALLRAFRHWASYDPTKSIKNWLLTIVTNEFLTQRTCRKREDLKHETAVQEELTLAPIQVACKQGEGAAPCDFSPADKAYSGEVAEAIAHSLPDEIVRALDSLTPEYRSVVERCDLGDDAYKEAAATLEIPIGTVMSRLSRGRQALRKSLHSYAVSVNAA